jgi:hypothetical protein
MSSYGQSSELTFFKTSGVGYTDIGNKDINNKNVGSINVGSKENYNKRSKVLPIFLI